MNFNINVLIQKILHVFNNKLMQINNNQKRSLLVGHP